MTHECDVVVIGGGAAGVAAALAARERGASVTLVRRAPGATALSAGGWAGALPEPFAAKPRAAGYDLEPATAPLPHPAGAVRRCEWAAAPQAAAALEDDALVIGITGLPWFRAPALARLWGDAAGRRLAARTVTLAGTPPAGWASITLARAVERDAAPLADAVAAAVRETGARRVILPAVLGVDDAAAALAAIRSAAGVASGEALGVPPSLPGWRLDRALRRAAESAGVRWLDGDAAVDVADSDTLRSLRLARSDEPVVLRAAAFVVAVGKYAGGGVTGGTRLIEPLLGSDVHVGNRVVRGDIFDPMVVTHLDAALPQPLFAAGVATDAAARPVTRTGVVAYENVLVAGTLRAGQTAGEWNLGDTAADGWAAGEAAARVAG
jgi:glycerol-3-phosphate dehydrogenase subunit B